MQRPHLAVPGLLLALVAGCGAPASDSDAEGARRTAEDYLHRVGAGDAQGVCDLGLARDGRTPLRRDQAQMDECLQLFRLRFEADAAQSYTALKDAKVARATVQGNHASIAKADTTGAETLVKNDRTLALLKVDGSWYVGSDDSPTAGAR